MNKIIKSGDGSHTLYNESIDEHYHSLNGAIQESMHVFIKNGLKCISKKEINIFEMGFGTGLNALLTAQVATRKQQKIHYTTVEKFPLNKSLTDKLNYSDNKFFKFSKEDFDKIHQAAWDKWHQINTYFSIRKIKSDVKDVKFDGFYDLIYFDAFSPDKQPDLWSEQVFKKLFKVMNKNGLLVTYSAKGVIRRRLESIGFEVERITGPPGKRHMIRALKE